MLGIPEPGDAMDRRVGQVTQAGDGRGVGEAGVQHPGLWLVETDHVSSDLIYGLWLVKTCRMIQKLASDWFIPVSSNFPQNFVKVKTRSGYRWVLERQGQVENCLTKEIKRKIYLKENNDAEELKATWTTTAHKYRLYRNCIWNFIVVLKFVNFLKFTKLS